MDRKAFFDALRLTLYPRGYSEAQVEIINKILEHGGHLPLPHLAYAFATAHGETGGKLIPIKENMNYSAGRIPQVFSKNRLKGKSPQELAGNPELLANVVYGVSWLGNNSWGDGWKYRGHGIVQLTGKANFQKLSDALGVDLVANPEKSLDPDIAVRALILGIEDGFYTGKDASDYLPEDSATLAQFTRARQIINGQFAASQYASYALSFQEALKEAGYRPGSAAHSQASSPNPLLALFKAIFGGRK